MASYEVSNFPAMSYKVEVLSSIGHAQNQRVDGLGKVSFTARVKLRDLLSEGSYAPSHASNDRFQGF